jgi:hypothetical protein
LTSVVANAGFIATGYSLQHVQLINPLETKDLTSESSYASAVRYLEIVLLDSNMLVDFITGLKSLYRFYSINTRQVELGRIRDELNPFWKHYISQVLLLSEIQKTKT